MAVQRRCPPEPRDVVDGMPDRAANRPLWKYLLIAGVFVAWLGVLAIMHLLARK